MRICKECPVATMIDGDRPRYQEGLDSGLLFQNAQWLSGKFSSVLRGTVAGFNEQRIEEIRQDTVRNWGNVDDPDGEAAYLESHPEIAKATHDCEVRVQLGNCAVHQA